MIELYFLIILVNAKISNPWVELGRPKVTATNEANTEIDTHQLTTATKLRKCSK